MKSVYVMYWKRVLDIFLSTFILVLLSWLVVIIFLLYFFSFQFPIIYKQKRIGRYGNTFVMYKFRTLREGTDENLQDRRFWLGDLLRFFSLDELPQLWHVLRGDMSLTGPRPMPVEYLSLMSEEQKQRHQLKPGITGWAQINGRHQIDWSTKFSLDLYYIHHVSFRLDIQIIVRTMVLLLFPKKDNSLIEKKFKGNKQQEGS